MNARRVSSVFRLATAPPHLLKRLFLTLSVLPFSWGYQWGPVVEDLCAKHLPAPAVHKSVAEPLQGERHCL